MSTAAGISGRLTAVHSAVRSWDCWQPGGISAWITEYWAAPISISRQSLPRSSRRSCKNQFYSDLITPLPEKIGVPGTEIHIFYALKMGEKYRERYLRHFADPVIHEQDMQHEELLACHPEEWAQLVKSIIG